MEFPPAIIIHGLPHALAARAPGRPVTLLSAPGAALYAGCLWWRELLAAAGFTGPALLDCATAPGRAWEGLRLGLKGIILAPCPAWDQLAAYAAAQGATLLKRPPEALDLAKKDAARHISAWLGG